MIRNNGEKVREGSGHARGHGQKNAKNSYIAALARIGVFFLVMVVFAVMGILIPLRPKVSQIEKRTLAKFPSFSFSRFWDGTFFSEMDTWYADTFPMREQLLSANASLNRLHGLQSETIIAGKDQKKGDQIPTGEDAIAGEEVQASTAEPQSQTQAPDTAVDESLVGADVVPEVFGDVYITDGRAFGLFYFVQDYSNRYCRLINTLQAQLGEQRTIYVLPAPVNSGIVLNDEAQEKLGSSDQKAAAEYIFANLDERVKAVPVYDNIRAHADEYVYFRTDHHWTALGAYYAYQEFAKVKGVEPHSLDSFQKMEFDGFLGSFYSDSQSLELQENPDQVTAYIPNGTNQMTYTERDGTVHEWKVVADASDYQKSAMYSAFVAGDNPYSEIHNPQITDGSSCLVIKESYANAFIPFLVDHYQDIYFIDYRYYKGSLRGLIEEKDIKDILFLNNLSSINADPILDLMEGLVNS